MAFLFSEKLAGVPRIHCHDDAEETIANHACFPMSVQLDYLPSLQPQEQQRVINLIEEA